MTKDEIIGTKWMVTQPGSSLQDAVFEFCPDGLLKYRDNFTSKWEMKYGVINISQNNGYAKLKGQIIENILQGTAENIKGDKWTFSGKLISKITPAGIVNTVDSTNSMSNSQSTLVDSIYATIKDYRKDESNNDSCITHDDISEWINQFDNNLRITILNEIDNIFKKRYCSKNKALKILILFIQKLAEEFNYPSPRDFLKNVNFLNLQPEGKSQGVMLSALDLFIQSLYGISLQECGTVSKKFSIYIDDILCTGLTLVNDIKMWSEKPFSLNKTNKAAVIDNSTKLILIYIFNHHKNYAKKILELKYKLSEEFAQKIRIKRFYKIENEILPDSKLNLILPTEIGQTKRVMEYKAEIIRAVDIRSNEKGWKIAPEEFFRPMHFPATEEFFTSVNNRKIVEDAFLQKGIQILDNTRSKIPNMRALGYSLPASKNFGFGALCFTWRNVPNNAPLVFWYSGGGFKPLFKVTRGKNTSANINSKPTPPNPPFNGNTPFDLPF